MAPPRFLVPDDPGTISTLAANIGTAATNVGSFTKGLEGLGNDLLVGWYGAAERMTAREIGKAAAFCDRLQQSFGKAAGALKAYSGALVTANGLLAAYTPTDDEKLIDPDLPIASSIGGSILQVPALTVPMQMTERNWEILRPVYVAAATAVTAINDAEDMVVKGAPKDVKAALWEQLPFLRKEPLIPGVGGRTPPAIPTGFSSTKYSKDVYLLQEVLQARGWRGVKLTGKYDANTADIVRKFQMDKKIKPANGKLTPATWSALWNKPITWP